MKKKYRIKLKLQKLFLQIIMIHNLKYMIKILIIKLKRIKFYKYAYCKFALMIGIMKI